VAKFFSKTAKSEILSITRIQNQKLWNLYYQTRSIVSGFRRNNGNANEEYLWHGSKLQDGLVKIIAGGFDSALSQSTIRGIWLSTNSQYSTNYCYRQPDGTKQILLVRSALGYIGSFDDDGSSSGIKVDSHHAGGTSRGHGRKDDQFGGGQDNRYVIKRNNQVYPAYVVEFR
jgi:Poly(ADP-ribose) polymerase catalytic domain